jgi:hypothetical protein
VTSDNILPPWQFESNCPQCGAKLSLEREPESGVIELKGNERLFCPVHGDVMSLEEARRIAFEENRDDIVEKARKIARDSLGDAFKK